MTASRCALILAAAVLSLAACGDRAGRETGGQQNIEAAAQKTKDAAIAAGHKAAELADKARDNTKAYLNSPEVRQRAADAKNAVKDAVDGPQSSPDDANKK